MPRILLDVSEGWHSRFENGVLQVLDTLEGIEHQLRQLTIEPSTDNAAKIMELVAQLRDLRTNVRSWQIVF